MRFFRSGAPARSLGALGRKGTDSYDLVDRLPRSPARVAAWNAYVCQTYADKLVAACRDSGVARSDTAGLVSDLYALVPVWLECAEGAGAPRDLPFPHWHTPDRCWEQLVGMRETLEALRDRKSTRLNSSHGYISYAVFCLKKKKKPNITIPTIQQQKNIITRT